MVAPQRGAEVRQLALPIQQGNVSKRKDNSTVTSPVEVKPVKIGDPKVRSKLTFEVVTARVIESGGKKHVVSLENHSRDPIIRAGFLRPTPSL